jgi:Uma2 family endonuclease
VTRGDDDARIADLEGDGTMQPEVQPGGRLTYDDFLRLPDDGLRHELIDGVHYVSAPNIHHQRIVGRLYLELGNYIRQHPSAGEVLLGPFDVVLSDFDVVEPDLLFVADWQRQIMTSRNASGAPALVVEVLSPSTRRVDEVLKRRLFDEHQVREYWLVDPVRAVVTVHRRAPDGRLSDLGELTAEHDETLTTPLLPGFSTSVRQLFSESRPGALAADPGLP